MSSTKLEPIKKSNNKLILLLLIPLAIYFIFGMQHLAKFETADEHYWLYDAIDGRVHNYWEALSTGNWLGTRINDKPGITLAYVSGVGLLFQQNPTERFAKLDNSLSQYNPDQVLHNNFVFRLPILIFNGLFSFFFYWAIRRLTRKKWLALFATTLILLNPILLGISQIVNPDALLWVFSFASFLSFFLYLQYEQKKDVFFAALFLGLALLSKYTAVIFIPFFFVLILIHLLYESEGWSRERVSRSIRSYFLAYFSVLFGALIVFSLMMPAVFVDPIFLYNWTIGFKGMGPIFFTISSAVVLLLLDAKLQGSKFAIFILDRSKKLRQFLPKIFYLLLFLCIFLTFLNLSISGNGMNIKGLAFDTTKKIFVKQHFMDKFFLDLQPLTFSLTPLVFFSLLYAWAKSFFKKMEFDKLVFSLSVFAVSFYSAVIKQDLLLTIRYTILLYPFMMFLSAIAIWDFLKYFHKIPAQIIRISTFIFILAASSSSLYLIAPFYFNYTNNLLPKERMITGAWGYGGYEAAQYLNKLPNAKNLTAWSDYWGFCPFFVGKCVQANLIVSTQESIDDVPIDYYVKSRRGSVTSKEIWTSLKKNMDMNPQWRYEIDGRPKNFISIYKAKNPKYKLDSDSKSQNADDSISGLGANKAQPKGGQNDKIGSDATSQESPDE